METTTASRILQPGAGRRIRNILMIVVAVMIVLWVAAYFLFERPATSSMHVQQSPAVLATTVPPSNH